MIHSSHHSLTDDQAMLVSFVLKCAAVEMSPDLTDSARDWLGWYADNMTEYVQRNAIKRVSILSNGTES